MVLLLHAMQQFHQQLSRQLQQYLKAAEVSVWMKLTEKQRYP